MTSKPLKPRKTRSFKGVHCSIEELKEWLKLISGQSAGYTHCSIEELKEWLKLVKSTAEDAKIVA